MRETSNKGRGLCYRNNKGGNENDKIFLQKSVKGDRGDGES